MFQRYEGTPKAKKYERYGVVETFNVVVMSPFHGVHTASYSPLLETICLSKIWLS